LGVGCGHAASPWRVRAWKGGASMLRSAGGLCCCCGLHAAVPPFSFVARSLPLSLSRAPLRPPRARAPPSVLPACVRVASVRPPRRVAACDCRCTLLATVLAAQHVASLPVASLQDAASLPALVAARCLQSCFSLHLSLTAIVAACNRACCPLPICRVAACDRCTLSRARSRWPRESICSLAALLDRASVRRRAPVRVLPCA